MDGISVTNLNKHCKTASFCANDMNLLKNTVQNPTAAPAPQINPAPLPPQKPDEFKKSKADSTPISISPLAVGLTSAVLWFGIGFGIDRLLGSIFKNLKSPLKSSLIINGVFGAVMGITAYFKEKNH